jgi:hypothetical protein
MATKSTSPVGGKRGCICKDGTYNKECCTGELDAQGIGSTVEQATETIIINTNTERVITNNN